jgi:hypothetical protein
MSLRIGFDLDGVLADMDSALAREAEVLFGEAMVRRISTGPDTGDDGLPDGESKETVEGGQPVTAKGSGDEAEDTPPATKLRMTTRQQRRLWKHVTGIENFWESLNELEPGVIPKLSALAADRRWEIIFLTKRPETAGSTSQVQSQRWLEAHGFPLPSVFVVQRSRGRIAAALGLDFVIDDTPENCLDVVVDSKARSVLVWRDDAKKVPAAARRLGIGVVSNVAECLTILEEVDETHQGPPGMVDRVMQMLGLKDE